MLHIENGDVVAVSAANATVFSVGRHNDPVRAITGVQTSDDLPGAQIVDVDAVVQQAGDPNFRFIATMTEVPHSNKTWNGETGRINKEILSKYLNDLRGPIYYIAGPPALVSGMRKMLVECGVDEDDIRSNEFAGY